MDDFFQQLCKGAKFGNTKNSKNIGFNPNKNDIVKKSMNKIIESNHSNNKVISSKLDFFSNNKIKNSNKEEDNSNLINISNKKEDNDNDVTTTTINISKKEKIIRSQEEIDLIRKQNKLIVSDDCPSPMLTYDEYHQDNRIPQWLYENIIKLGFNKPTPIQIQSIPSILTKKDFLGSAPTGSGKTLSFLIPIISLLQKPKKILLRSIIMVPTRELAQQILREFDLLVNSKKWSCQILDKLQDNLNKLDIGITTPLRLLQLLKDNKLSLDNCKHIIIDEVDKLLDLGFNEQIDEILSYKPTETQLCLFSATLPQNVINLSEIILKNPIHVKIGNAACASKDIDQELKFVTNEDGKLLTLRLMIQDGLIKPPTMIFVQSKDRAKELFNELVYDNIRVDMITSEKTKKERDDTIKNFRLGKIWVLICTDLMSRGVDFYGIECVINYDVPQSQSTYIHRIGRTGRAGRKGKAYTFFTEEDIDHIRPIVSVVKNSGCKVPEFMNSLKKERRHKNGIKRGDTTVMDRKHITTNIWSRKNRSGKQIKEKKKTIDIKVKKGVKDL